MHLQDGVPQNRSECNVCSCSQLCKLQTQKPDRDSCSKCLSECYFHLERGKKSLGWSNGFNV